MIITKAEDNRRMCKYCHKTINKGENYFNESKEGWRSSFTINLCRLCLFKFAVETGITNKEIDDIKKEVLAECL